MVDKFRASRLTPEELMQWAVRHHQLEAVLYASAWAADIAELREQLRAYRGAERIAHDELRSMG